MYSHRDHRAYRDAYRLVGTVVVTTVALLGLAVLVGSELLGVASLLALVGLGLASLLASERLVDRYLRDLREAASDAVGSGRLRAEAWGRIGPGPAEPRHGAPSPNVRRGGRAR